MSKTKATVDGMTTGDGGPAFPCAASPEQVNRNGDVYRYGVDAQSGMTLRDWFAGQALMGDHAQNGCALTDEKCADVAANCYAMADAMLAERARVSP